MRLWMMLLASVAVPVWAAAPAPVDPAALMKGTTEMDGLLPVHLDKSGGRILLTLPAAASDGVSGRFLYATALRSGIGSSVLGLDRAMNGPTQILAFRRIGRKVAIVFENPRFRASNAPAAEQAAARDSFAFSTAWMGDIAATNGDGSFVVDIAPFLARDVIGIAPALKTGGAKDYKLADALSAADPGSVKVFPDNIEIDAIQTYESDTPNDEIQNIAPEPRQISLTVHHSLIRLPDAGYRPRRFDPRAGGFASQAVDFGVPLGGDVVYDFANRFRLDKIDPAAARSRVKKPIVFYIDRSAPEPIRTALAEGVSWWAKAFDAAGYVDAFQVKILPEGADPLDVRYNVVNWVDRATRGWSYGQVIADPRTGEIVKGSVLLGALRVRQDMLIFEGLVGADKVGTGGPNDPVKVSLQRLRELGAHEVGHALGLVHNFAASTQDRASVMDYPAPRIGLVNGAPDLSDAYGNGVGKWDDFAIDWLYGEPAPGKDADADARAKAGAAQAADLRFTSDGDARATDTAQPFASMWDDGPDPAAELRRLMDVRRAAIDRFGLAALKPDEPVANLRRKFVPIWLLHRYEVDATAKAIGGVDFAYAVAGDGKEASPPVPAAAQRDALDALLGTLTPAALTVPDRLLPLLSAAQNGNDDRQYDIEIFATAGGPVFDPLVAADVAAQVTLDALLAPTRLARVAGQHARYPQMLGVDELLDRISAATIDRRQGDLGRRIAYRAIVTLARTARDKKTPPEIAAAIDDRLHGLGERLAKASGDPADRAWSRSLARTLADEKGLDRITADAPRAPTIPPGMPIGGDEGEWMELP
ncbi:MAG: hypothetical protein JWO65_2494 [Sphingomonas bacterium]|nr:hypothetical protein [Sphingomonas bacterium]